MKNKKTILTLVTALLLTAGMVAGVQTQPEKATKNNPNFQLGDAHNPSLFDQLSKVFSFLRVSDPSTEPGNQIQFSAEVDVQGNEDSGNLVKIVEVYRCDDTQCEDPNPFVEAAREGMPPGGALTDGETVTWSVKYVVPEQESEYEAVSYLWNRETQEIVSDTPTTEFVVQTDVNKGTQNEDTDSDGVVDRNDDCPSTFGKKSNGCPQPTNDDSDGDGVTNSADECRNRAGPVSNNGCPVKENPVPVGLLILASGIIVLGGAVYLWLN